MQISFSEKSLPVLLLVLFIIYFFQQDFTLFASLALLSGVIIMFTSIFYYFRALNISGFKNSIILCFTGFFISFTISLFLSYDFDTGLYYHMKRFVFTNFIYFPFFIFSRKRFINDGYFRYMLIIYLFFYIYDYFFHFDSLSQGESIELGEITNNASYNFVTLLPLLLFFKDFKQRAFLYSIILILILYSAKRGAILITLFSALILFKTAFAQLRESKHKFLNYFLLLILLIVGVNYITYFFENNEHVANRFLDMFAGDSSSRDELYSQCYEGFFSKDNIFRYLFGYGLNGTVRFTGDQAHNDWLQILVDNGFIGVFLLFSFYYIIFVNYLKCKDAKLKSILLLSFIVLFSRTLFSMSFSDISSFPVMMILGYVAGQEFLQRKGTNHLIYR